MVFQYFVLYSMSCKVIQIILQQGHTDHSPFQQNSISKAAPVDEDHYWGIVSNSSALWVNDNALWEGQHSHHMVLLQVV